MASIVQSTAPTIKFYSYKDNSLYDCGENLQAYSFNQSINNISGEFNISIKENTSNYTDDSSFYNKVHTLDIVEISETDKGIDFIGVIVKKSFNGVANGFNRIINISGKSLSWLFEYLTISLDATAMAWTKSNFNVEVANINTKLSSVNGEDFKPVNIKNAVVGYYSIFKDVMKAVETLTNVSILNIIEKWFGSDSECFDVEEIKFKYPICSNLLTNGTVQFINYLRNLLPSNVYEIFYTMIDNKPKIRIRECPFPYTEDELLYSSKWIKLKSTPIDPITLVNYTLTQSIDEVYTIFYSYLEGSPISPEFQEKINAINAGGNVEALKAKYNSEKLKIYGYKPLKCNFVGYNPNSKESKDDLGEQFEKLNQKLKDWYGNLDEMYDATITVIRDISRESAQVGEKVSFLGGEFYVTGTEHSWRYGQSIQVTYHCERGGVYNYGVFKELQNVTKPHGELS